MAIRAQRVAYILCVCQVTFLLPQKCVLTYNVCAFAVYTACTRLRSTYRCVGPEVIVHVLRRSVTREVNNAWCGQY